MSGYTPTTEEVREAIAEWAWARRMFRPELGQSDGKEADRWLAKHDAEVRARAIADCILEVRMIPCWAPKDDRDGGEFDLDGESHRRVVLERLAEVRASVVSEEPEWEYGVESRFEESDEAYDALEWGSREQAEAVARDQNDEEENEDGYVRLVYRVVKRVPAVPAGPWLPVEQEGGADA